MNCTKCLKLVDDENKCDSDSAVCSDCCSCRDDISGDSSSSDKKSEETAKKLYVGGLPYSTNGDTLRASFEKAGPVDSVAIIMDKMTGRSKGFGFVEMTNGADAKRAIEMWNGKDFEGRNLTVNVARPMQPRQDRPAGGSGDYGHQDRNSY